MATNQMEIKGERGITYQFEITDTQLIITVKWSGAQIKRFTLKARRDDACTLRTFLDCLLDPPVGG